MRFLRLSGLALLVLLARGESFGAGQERADLPRRRLIFLDGTRMEILDYELQGELVVFRTPDGDLHSVARSLVDIEATERWNGGGAAPIDSDGRVSPPDGDRGTIAGGSWAPIVLDGPPAPVPPEVVNRDGQGRATMRAIRLKEPLVVDGQLEEPLYREVPGVDGFLQAEPDEGAPATERTEVWVSYDEENVYLSGRCWDSHLDRMVANEMRRDNFGIFRNENFAVVLDTFYDRRNAFFFYTNPLGALFDGLVTDENDVNRDWNTVWDVRTGRFDEGWTVEMAIPFKSLRYRSAGPQVWGINFRRVVRWKNEYSYLTRIPASFGPRGMTKISSAGTLVGLETPPGSKNLEIKPYLKGETITDLEAEPPFENDLDGDFGFDLKYGLTRGLIFDFTYNTDFAQVEIDEQQVNLTRFNLFLPEKRDFFLEGRGIFQFGGTSSPRPSGMDVPSDTPIVFYTRRIGLEEEDMIPIGLGGRLTGRAGPYSIGALAISADEYPPLDVSATTFSVLRIKRDILRRSAIGVVGTLRSPALDGGGNNTVFGVDTTLAFYENLNLNGYFAVSDTPGLEADSTSYLAQLDWQPDLYGLKLERLVVGPGFNPEVGFMRREDFQRNFAEARFSTRPASIGAFRKLNWTGGLNYTTDNHGTLESRIAELKFEIDFENSDQFSVTYSNNYEFLPEEFEITDDIVLPVKEYDFQNVQVSYQLGPQRKLSGWLSLQAGGFFSGSRTEVGYNGRVEVTPRFSVEPRISLNWVDLEEGDFKTNLIGGRVNFTFSARTVLSALIQYNSEEDALSSNVRFRWEYRPGSDLFVVYSDAYDTLGVGLPSLQNRSFVVKLTRLFRF